MSLTTFSTFYYGHSIDSTNNKIDFDEGGSQLTASLNVGAYSLSDFVTEAQRAMNVVGGQVYTVAVSRATRLVTVSATANFTLRVSTGTNTGISTYALLGFTGANRTAANTYTGDSVSGKQYSPQFILQDHIPSTNWQQAMDAVITKSASGAIQAVSFGTEKFTQLSMKYITNIPQPNNGPILNDQSALSNIQSFLQYLTTKAPIEYMSDTSNTSTFETLILDSNPDSQTGTGYKLKELYDHGMPGYFQTAILKMRVR